MTEDHLSALLRLKRFEKPPVQYFDRLLADLHRRQRAELLRQPLWKIALERVQTFFSEHSMSHGSFAGAMTAALVVGIVGIGLITPRGEIERGPTLASAPAPQPDKLLNLQATASIPPLGIDTLGSAPPGLSPVMSQPRYVIDARPVSYEPSPSIQF